MKLLERVLGSSGVRRVSVICICVRNHRKNGRRGRSQEWDGKRGSLHVPRRTCSLSDPVTLISPQHGDVCTHKHAYLSVHKGNNGEVVPESQAWKRHRSWSPELKMSTFKYFIPKKNKAHALFHRSLGHEK